LTNEKDANISSPYKLTMIRNISPDFSLILILWYEARGGRES
jgi:hypothetical protein